MSASAHVRRPRTAVPAHALRRRRPVLPILGALCAALTAAACGPAAQQADEAGGLLPARTVALADRAVQEGGEDLVDVLADLVAFRTVHVEGTENARNPEFVAMTGYLRERARQYGLGFEDHGAVLLITLGEGEDRLGIITHGDVQPADPARWAGDPFRLDTGSEPGRLVGRGTEDDKGPIATALLAMRTLRRAEVPLKRRVELIVIYTEESDWEPVRAFLAAWTPPQLNVAIDARYPVVIAEKGWTSIHLRLPAAGGPPPGEGASLLSFTGGSFLAQVPEVAEAVIVAPGEEVEATLRQAARAAPEVRFEFRRQGGRLRIVANGVSAHSMDPENGVNAITHLAMVLQAVDWPETPAALMARAIDDLVGTGDYAEKFGGLAYRHPFMGPLTLTMATLREEEGELVAGISARRPAGRSAAEVESSIRSAVEDWKRANGVEELVLETDVLDPYYLQDAAHVPVLLDVFRHYTGIADAGPVSIGGGTNARLFPNGVNFGPAMPGAIYTGHSEHEFLERRQLLLNLRMYTAMLAELAGA